MYCFKGYTQVSEIITTEKNIFPCKSLNPDDQIPLLCVQYSAQIKVCKISGLEFSCTSTSHQSLATTDGGDFLYSDLTYRHTS